MNTRARHSGQRTSAGNRARRPLWLGSLRRLNRALAASRRVIDSTCEAADRASDRAARFPLRTTRELQRLGARLQDAMRRLEQAARGFSETAEAMAREPEQLADVPRLINDATGRWLLVAMAIDQTSAQLCAVQDDVLEDLLSGAIVPEEELPRRRPRITAVPRLISARDFLLCSRKSAHDRIASIPARRRRSPCRPAADAPRRISRGRAPPPVSNCLL